MKIICVGDNVCDCYMYEHTFYPGGNCVNVAVNAKRNGAEEAAYLGIFGTDEKADHIKYSLEQEGISYSFSRTMLGKSGQPGVNLTPEGDRVFVRRETNTVQTMAKLRLVQSDLEAIGNYDLMHTSCYSFLEEELQKLHGKTKISYDFSTIEDDTIIDKVAPYIDFAFISASNVEEEERKKLAESLLNHGVEIVCITRGEKPAELYHGSDIYYQEPLQTTVVDTMGAGDSFISGFLVAYMDGKTIKDSLYSAALSAKKTCKIKGGYGYPKPLLD